MSDQQRPQSTTAFCRLKGKLDRFEVATSNPALAVKAVKTHLDKNRTPPDGAVLALITTQEDAEA